MASFTPNISIREAPLQPKQSAILFVDIQNYSLHSEGIIYKELEKNPISFTYFQSQIPQNISNWQKLLKTFRQAKIEVLYTVIENLTFDGRDRSLDYKISGLNIPKGSFDGKVIDELQPINDEIVFPKSSSNVFVSTNIHYILGNLGVKQLVIVGALTDQCVDSAVRDACDLGYLVTLVSDACITRTKERHDSSLRNIKGYCRQRTTDELVAEVENLLKL
ncbi:Isochorismatase [Oopsacas minuta]|uniref:Isochorismatase n=1 Tax=Oopsacas minuta TaxID=111878 RepID=A0AAV7KF26_9METZ|nr:Isochorismatase [Oopsacas minuta]